MRLLQEFTCGTMASVLRACLRRPDASQATDHQVNHGDADHRFAGSG
jgi:hypothetical protein